MSSKVKIFEKYKGEVLYAIRLDNDYLIARDIPMVRMLANDEMLSDWHAESWLNREHINATNKLGIRVFFETITEARSQIDLEHLIKIKEDEHGVPLEI